MGMAMLSEGMRVKSLEGKMLKYCFNSKEERKRKKRIIIDSEIVM